MEPKLEGDKMKSPCTWGDEKLPVQRALPIKRWRGWFRRYESGVIYASDGLPISTVYLKDNILSYESIEQMVNEGWVTLQDR